MILIHNSCSLQSKFSFDKMFQAVVLITCKEFVFISCLILVIICIICYSYFYHVQLFGLDFDGS